MKQNHSILADHLLECPYCGVDKNQVVALLRILKLHNQKMIQITVDGYEEIVPMRREYIFNENAFNMHILYQCQTNNHYYCSSVDTFNSSQILCNSNETFYSFADMLMSDYTGKNTKNLFNYLIYYFTNPKAQAICK